MAKAGLKIREQVKYGVALPHATEERLQRTLQSGNREAPRQYWLTRSVVPLGGEPAAYPLLAEITEQPENASEFQLVHAFATTVGTRGEVTELWCSPPTDLSYRPVPDEPEASAKLRKLVPEEELILLNPLPYSKLQ